MYTATHPGITRKTNDKLACFRIENILQTVVLLVIFLLAGCGGGGGGTADTSTPDVINLVGSVGDGPITGATITVNDADGNLVGTVKSDASAYYKISVPGGTAFPVTITATGGTDIVTGTRPDFTMVTVALKKADLNSKKRTVNINPFSTLIVYMAQSMPGGLTTQNIEAAKQTLFEKFSFGLNPASIADPISSDIADTNIADIIKASEALGEMVRRTRDAIITSGNNIDGDDVIIALANDLGDGVLDGVGANTDSMISATSKIVTAQVLIEVIRNQLKVNGSLATTQLDNAILVSRPSSTMTMADVALTEDVLSQTQTELAAAQRITPSAELASLISVVDGLSNIMSSSEVNTMLPIGSESILDTTITLVPAATMEELSSIYADSSTSVDAPNVAPVISSIAPLIARESEAYSYDVNATDVNTGDTLKYELITAPAGMSINSANGIISWTPAASQVGAQDVTVRVTDNGSPAFSVSQNFSISVYAANNISVIRVNAGGGDYVDSKGQLWAADYGYNLGMSSTVNNSISGTVDDALYQSIRWHSTYSDSTAPELEYSFMIAPGDYAVRLHFADMYNQLRIYDIEIEGILMIDNLNIKNEVGVNAALIKNAVVRVVDGMLNIRFPRDTQSPWISAIEIIEVTAQDSSAGVTSDTAPISIMIPEASQETGTLSILGQPSNGGAVVSGNNITYTPNAGFDGQDIIIYEFVDANGTVTTNTITVTVTCDSCTNEANITLSWQANPESVSGYRVYYGADAANVTELASDIPVNSGLIDPTAPQLEYAATSDLNFYPGEQVCFKVQAYTDTDESALSQAICGTI